MYKVRLVDIINKNNRSFRYAAKCYYKGFVNNFLILLPKTKRGYKIINTFISSIYRNSTQFWDG